MREMSMHVAANHSLSRFWRVPCAAGLNSESCTWQKSYRLIRRKIIKLNITTATTLRRGPVQPVCIRML